MRAYIERHIFGTGALAVIVVALCLGWPDHDGVARANDAADDAILKVRTCIEDSDEASDISDSLKEALIKADVIEKDLLQTKVTNGMCKEMLQPIHDGTPVRKLLTAQNYIQNIELIEGAMREAADEESARGPDWHFSSDGSLMRFRAIAHTSEQVAAQAQYNGGIEGVEERELQAAAAARVAEDKDASIDTRLRQKEAALKKVGASAQEAAAGGRCSLEVDVLDEKADKFKDLEAYKIKPNMPKKMGQRETEQAGLVASPVTKEMFQEIRKKTREKGGDIAEASESDIHCVRLADQMKATLLAYHPEELRIDRRYSDDIRDLSSNQNTRWSWDIDPHGAGKVELILDLRYTISRKDQEFRQIPDAPVYDGVLKVTPHQSDSTQKGTEPWWHIW
jgi:hypothetical protein